MNKKKIIYIISILFTIILYSCTTNTVYHKYNTIQEETWNREDTLYFTISDSIESGTYNTEIGIRHTASYPYKDLWLSVVTPNRDKADTIHVYLTNDRGNWNSNGSTGGYFQYSVSGIDLNYRSSADSIIKVCHIMNDNHLKGITDIGIKISRK